MASNSRIRVRLLAPNPEQPSLEAYICVTADGVKLNRASSDALICSLPFSTVQGFTEDPKAGLIVLKATRNGQVGEIKLEGSGSDPQLSINLLRSDLSKHTSPYTKKDSGGQMEKSSDAKKLTPTQAAAERASQLRATIEARQATRREKSETRSQEIITGRTVGESKLKNSLSPSKIRKQFTDGLSPSEASTKKRASLSSLEELTALANEVASESKPSPLRIDTDTPATTSPKLIPSPPTRPPPPGKRSPPSRPPPTIADSPSSRRPAPPPPNVDHSHHRPTISPPSRAAPVPPPRPSRPSPPLPSKSAAASPIHKSRTVGATSQSLLLGKTNASHNEPMSSPSQEEYASSKAAADTSRELQTLQSKLTDSVSIITEQRDKIIKLTAEKEKYRIEMDAANEAMEQLQDRLQRQQEHQHREEEHKTQQNEQHERQRKQIRQLQQQLQESKSIERDTAVSQELQKEIDELLVEREKIEVQNAVLQERLIQESDLYRQIHLLMDSTQFLDGKKSEVAHTFKKATVTQRSLAREYLMSKTRKSSVNVLKHIGAKRMNQLLSYMKVRTLKAGEYVYDANQVDDLETLPTIIVLNGSVSEFGEDGETYSDDASPDGTVGSVYNELGMIMCLQIDKSLRCNTDTTVGVLSMSDFYRATVNDFQDGVDGIDNNDLILRLLEEASKDPIFFATAMTPHGQTLRRLYHALEMSIEFKNDLDRVITEKVEAENEISQVEALKTKQEEELSDVTERLASFETKHEKNVSMISELNAKLVERDEKISTLTKQVENLNEVQGTHLHNMEADLVRMKTNLEEANAAKKDLEHDVNELKEMKESNVADLRNAVVLKEEMQQKIKLLEDETLSLRDQLDSVNQQLHERDKEKKSKSIHQGKFEIITRKWKESEERLQVVTEEKNTVESKVLGLQQDLNKMMEVLKESNRQLGESAKARQELQKRVSEEATSEHEQASLRSQLIAAKQEHDNVQRELDIARSQFQVQNNVRMKYPLRVCIDSEAPEGSNTNDNGTRQDVRIIPSTLEIDDDGFVNIFVDSNDQDHNYQDDSLDIPKVEINNILSWSITDDEGKFLTFHVKRIFSKTRSKSRRKSSLSTPSTKVVTQIEVIKLQTQSKEESMEIIAAIVATYMKVKNESVNVSSKSLKQSPSKYSASHVSSKPLSPTHQAIASVIDTVSTINDELQRKLDFPGDIMNSSTRRSAESTQNRYPKVKERFPSPILSRPTTVAHHDTILDYNDGHFFEIDSSSKTKGKTTSFLEMELNQTKEEAEELRIQLNFLESVTLSNTKENIDIDGTKERLEKLQRELEREKVKNASLELELHSRVNTPNKDQAVTDFGMSDSSEKHINPLKFDSGVVQDLKALKGQWHAMKSSDGTTLGAESTSAADDESRNLFNAMMDLMRHQDSKEKREIQRRDETENILQENEGALTEVGSRPRSKYGSSADVLLKLSSVRKEMNQFSGDNENGVSTNDVLSVIAEQSDQPVASFADVSSSKDVTKPNLSTNESQQNHEYSMGESTQREGTNQLLSVIDGILGSM